MLIADAVLVYLYRSCSISRRFSGLSLLMSTMVSTGLSLACARLGLNGGVDVAGINCLRL